jgi:hypothetical protein
METEKRYLGQFFFNLHRFKGRNFWNNRLVTHTLFKIFGSSTRAKHGGRAKGGGCRVRRRNNRNK